MGLVLSILHGFINLPMFYTTEMSHCMVFVAFYFVVGPGIFFVKYMQGIVAKMLTDFDQCVTVWAVFKWISSISSVTLTFRVRDPTSVFWG